MNPALRIILLGGNRPALDLDFTTGVLDSRITASGGAGGTRVNSSGLIVAASTPRFDYDPVSLAARGLLVEEQRTNLLVNSLINGTNLSTQSVTVSATAYTLSFYGTGTVTLSGTYTGSLVGSAVYPTRSTLTFTPTAGTLTLTVTGTVQFAQLEAGSFATSYIPTGAAAVTRTADSIVMPTTGWLNDGRSGTFVWEGEVPSNNNYNRYFDVFLSSSNYIPVFQSPALTANFWIVSGGVTRSQITITTLAAGTAVKLGVSYTTGAASADVNSGTISNGTPVSIPTGMTGLYIGRAGAAYSYEANAHIKRLRYWPRRLSDVTLQSLTS